jgi:predicted DNA-binding transcriptional regulator YafY
MTKKMTRSERLLSMVAELLLDEGPYLVKEAAEKYRITEQMVRKDLEKLEKFLNEANQRTYIIRRQGKYEGNFQRSVANLSSEVLLYLFLSLKQLEPILGQQGREAYEKLWKHALSILPVTEQRKLKEWSPFYHISMFGYPIERGHFYEALTEVFDAIMYNQMLSFTLRGEKKLFDPYGIYYAKETFYLLGVYHDLSRRSMKSSFSNANIYLTRLDRISEIERLRDRKSPLTKQQKSEGIHFFKKNQVDAALKTMLEAERSPRRRDDYVFYILDEKVRDRIKERRWHGNQEWIDKEQVINGRKVFAELRLYEVDSPVELKKWVLGWGSAIEVKKPVRFREEIKEEIRKLNKLYGIGSIFRS